MAENKAKKQKRPTALKRKIQSDKKYLQNKAFKSQIRTSLKKLKSYAEAGNQEQFPAQLSTVTSLLDKAIKKGIFKKNKVDRLKSKASKLLSV